jgi:hypothetical protein
MRDVRFYLKPKYTSSRALVIGIDEYKKASPLLYAVSDAEGVRDALVQELGFDVDKIQLLSNSEATRHTILKAYLAFASDSVQFDDRIVVFFAGHGCTKWGMRGEVGFLVPHDGDLDDMSTLIRWDELTRNAEIIPAKHLFFIMDACYGGLALNRDLQGGSVRFRRDMLRRLSRQVLTAGKGDEPVLDSGGPLPKHSVFTGHLLEGLRGAAAYENGVITATGLMAYVCGKVSSDQNSHQTPHYGQIEGDGDFILKAPNLFVVDEDLAQEKKEIDELYEIPAISLGVAEEPVETKVRTVKKLLAGESSSIELSDFFVGELKNFLQGTGEDFFAVSGQVSVEELQERMTQYERISSDLCSLLPCLGYWGRESHRIILRKVFSRLTDRLESRSGLTAWLNLRWYPVLLALYSTGIAAVEARRYDSLADIFHAPSVPPGLGDQYRTTALATVYATLELNRMNLFKLLPGHERLYTPLSEYLFKLLQPRLDDLFFFGREYERVFDDFEVLLALVIATEAKLRGSSVWGPVGRFGWKFQHSTAENNSLLRLVDEAKKEGHNWPPVRAGVFGSAPAETVIEVAEEYRNSIARLGWY